MSNEQNKNAGAWGQFKEAVRKAVRSLWPGLGEFDNYQYGKIAKLNLTGGKVGAKSKGVSANIQLLNRDLSENRDREEIKDVPFDSLLFNSKGALYSLPLAGSICRIGFMYNDPGFPFIHSVTNEGATIPAGTAGKFVITADNGDTVTIDGDGITARSSQAALRLKLGVLYFKTSTFNSDMDTVLNTILLHTHMVATLGAPTGSPTTPVSVPVILPTVFNEGTL
jgi:hypothetical protein